MWDNADSANNSGKSNKLVFTKDKKEKYAQKALNNKRRK